MAKLKLTYKRPPKIRQYTKQVAFIDDPARFTVVEATTKAGKTVGCIVWLFEESLRAKSGDNCWWIAPVSSQAKIAFKRTKRYLQKYQFFWKSNEVEMSIRLMTGVTIFFKSADNPDSLYGDDVVAAVIDEATRCKKESWFAVFSTLTATKGRCKIIGNVKGTDNWVYELGKQAKEGKANWSYHKLTAKDAVDAGILDQEVIDEAEATLPNGVFLELYYAIPFENSSNKFCYSFSEKKHVNKCDINPEYPIYFSFDFNKNPISCAVIQWYDNMVNVVEMIKLPNSNIYNLCDQLRTKYMDVYDESTILVTGDYTGSYGSAMVKDELDYYKIIKDELGLMDSQIQIVPNPKLVNNQVLVNAVLEHMIINIDPDNAQGLIFDMKFVEIAPDGKIQKGDRNDPKQQADALDTFRYFLNKYLSKFTASLKRINQEEIELEEEDINDEY